MTTSTLERPDEVVVFEKESDVTDGATLKVQDRCDHCGAQAYNIAFSRNTGNKLLFCNHHIGKHEKFLLAQNFRIEKHSYSFKSGIKEIPPAEKR